MSWEEFQFQNELTSNKEELEITFERYLYEIDGLPLKPLHKIRFVNTFIYSKTKWEFSIYKLPTT